MTDLGVTPWNGCHGLKGKDLGYLIFAAQEEFRFSGSVDRGSSLVSFTAGSAFVDREPSQSAKAYCGCVAVHEISHAVAPVRHAWRENGAGISRPVPIQCGLETISYDETLSSDWTLRCSALNEYAAEGHGLAYAAYLSGCEQPTTTRQVPLYHLSRNRSGWESDAVEIVRKFFGESVEIPVAMKKLSPDSPAIRAGYSSIVGVLDQIGEFIFPHLEKSAAAVRFRDLAGRAQLCGDISGLLTVIRDSIGSSGAQLVARCGAPSGLDQPDVVLFLLHTYLSALRDPKTHAGVLAAIDAVVKQMGSNP